MLALLAVMMLIAAACSEPSESSTSSTTDTPTTTTTPATGPTSPPTTTPPPSQERLDALAALPGQLAVGRGSALVLVDPDGANAIELDGSEPGVAATQPVWSNSGARLAWSRTSAEGHELVVLDPASAGETTVPLPGPTAYYLQWTFNDSGLAYLRDGTSEPGVELGVAPVGGSATPLAITAPLYFSWAPRSPTLALHLTNERMIVIDAALDIGPGEDIPAVAVVEETGDFTAPAWVDDTTLLGLTDAGLALIDVLSGRTTVLVEADGPVQFVLSPDRERVAYAVPGSNAGLSLASIDLAQGEANTPAGLNVIDLGSGRMQQVSASAPATWEWSPDSQQLAFLDVDFANLPIRAQWNFWNGVEASQVPPHYPSQKVAQAYLPFFEQYTQSLHRWSPDSSAFAYAGRVDPEALAPSVWVHLIGSDEAPTPIVTGDLATWSP